MASEGSATGVDISPDMVAAAIAAPKSSGFTVAGQRPVDFVVGDMTNWTSEVKYDLTTSFMALHWVPERELPGVLRGIRGALPDSTDHTPPGWFVASFNGDNSMQV